VLQGLTT
jgi:small subunit ribosomal protein S11